MDKQPLSDSQLIELLAMMTYYHREYDACRKAGLTLAASILLGSFVESVLMTLFHNFHEEAEAARQTLPRDGRPSGALLKMGLGQLLSIAAAAGWCEGDKAVEEALDRIASHRNLVHPAVRLKNLNSVMPNETDLELAEGVVADLLKKADTKVRSAIDPNVRVPRELFEVGGDQFRALVPRQFWPEDLLTEKPNDDK